MKKAIIAGMLAATQVLGGPLALAGPWEDGMAAYNRGDYVPAVQLFRPLAQGGNARAQSVLGSMYKKGQGVAKNSAHAFMWFTLAAKRGDGKAKAELRSISAAMTPEELAHAREMLQACEASDYRNCEF